MTREVAYPFAMVALDEAARIFDDVVATQLEAGSITPQDAGLYHYWARRPPRRDPSIRRRFPVFGFTDGRTMDAATFEERSYHIYSTAFRRIPRFEERYAATEEVGRSMLQLHRLRMESGRVERAGIAPALSTLEVDLRYLLSDFASMGFCRGWEFYFCLGGTETFGEHHWNSGEEGCFSLRLDDPVTFRSSRRLEREFGLGQRYVEGAVTALLNEYGVAATSRRLGSAHPC